jgi:thiopeptide-type bacteriocin biosynthesis protein
MERNNIIMNKLDKEFTIIETLLIRKPTLPISNLYKDEFDLKVALNNQTFMTALSHANSQVYNLAEKYAKGGSFSEKDTRRLNKTIFNYWQRIHIKTVPFGMFADIGLISWGDNSNLKLKKKDVFGRIDMEALQKLMNVIFDDEKIKPHVKLYPNNTIYKYNEKIRYNEKNEIGGNLEYKLSSVEINPYIEKIILFCKSGKTIDEIVTEIYDGLFEKSEFESFTRSLIESQILIPELQIKLTERENLSNLLELFTQLTRSNIYCENLKYYSKVLNDLYQVINLFNTSNLNLIEINNQIYQTLNIPINDIQRDRVLQIDVISQYEPSITFIDYRLKDNLLNSVKIMSAFTSQDKVINLELFKKKFSEKYSDAFIPLMEAIDSDIGISYGTFEYSKKNIFLNDIGFINNNPEESYSKNINENRIILYKKYIDSLITKSKIIWFDDKDFDKLKTSEKELADTFQIIFSKTSLEEENYVILTAGNSCAVNLISRTSYASSEIENIIKDVFNFENEKNKNAIVAEIVHLPGTRIGNITHRSISRKFEIPIYTQSVKDEDHQISLDDLLVGIRNGRVILISKKYKKEVLPKLTNAHNYGKDTLPVYQFLSDLSYQEILPSVQLEIGNLDFITDKFPRIQYKNIILRKATWKLFQADLDILKNSTKDNLGLNIEKLLKKHELPSINNYLKQGEENLVNWNNLKSVEFFLDEVKDYEFVLLFEHIFDTTKPYLIDNNGCFYNNEIIAFVKNNTLKSNVFQVPNYYDFEATKRTYKLGEEWIYLKIYCSYSYYPILINKVIEILDLDTLKTYYNGFFFIPFNDPEFHLRVRFNLTEIKFYTILTDYIIEYLNNDNNIFSLSLDTYSRELERYGFKNISLAEAFFSLDSNFVIKNYKYYLSNLEHYLPIVVIRNINLILNGFNFSLQQRGRLINHIANNYGIEFNMVKGNPLFIQVNKSIKEQKALVENMLLNGIPELYFNTKEDFQEYLDNEKKFKDSINNYYNRFKNQFGIIEYLFDFVQSIIHMHCIRCFIHKPRENELFVYHALSAYYISQTFRNQNLINKS